MNIIPRDILESLADLYHVEEYDILIGVARSQACTKSPKEEKELIPFFKLIKGCFSIQRILDGSKDIDIRNQ